MNKNRKNGFTLVELLVVIAILAILAVVSVVGYTSFTKKAKIADDISLTTQLNTILQANESTDGENKYPHKAVEELVDGGFDVTKFTPTTEKYNYVYDLSQNRVFLLDEAYNVVSPSDLTLSDDKVSVFGFAESQDEVNEFNNHGYSVYLKSTYNSDSVTTSKGVDVGFTEDLATINYVNVSSSASTLVHTNSYETVVNIYGPNDVVKHYGLAKEISVAAIAMSSYHENGSILGNINVAKGKIEIESGASVSNIVIKEVAIPNSASNEKVTPVKSEEISVKVSAEASVTTVQSEVSEVKATDIVKGTGSQNVKTMQLTEHTDAVAYNVTSDTWITTWDGNLSNGTTMLLKNLEDKVYYVYASKGVKATFDMNGHKLKTDEKYGKNPITGELTFKDSIGTGELYCKVNYVKTSDTNDSTKYGQDFGILRVSNGGKLIVESGNINAMDASGSYSDANGQYGISFEQNATVIINGGTIKSGWWTICANGDDTSNNTVIINGGKLIAVKDYALYLPSGGTTTINGGLIDGSAGAITINRGSLNITGGSFNSDGTGNVGNWSDGTGANKTNALINANSAYGNVTINVSGGTFNVQKLDVFAVNEEKNTTIISISGGIYNKYIDKWVNSSYECVKVNDGKYSVQKKS